MHQWLNTVLQSFSRDQLEGRATDLPEDIRALWDTCATQFRILRSLVSYTDLGEEQERLTALVARLDERAARLKAPLTGGGAGGEDDADSDDELVPCPPNCGDCGGLRYGCGITRGDVRRWSEPVPEVEEPHPMDGPQSFQAITASLTIHGDTSHYAAGLLWVPAESFEPVEQIGMVTYAIKRKISPWQAHHYSYLYWAATTPDPRTESAEPVDGLYGIREWGESVGCRPLPIAHDGEYTFGCISHNNMAAWSFKVETVTEGTPEYERYNALESVWEHLGIEIEHTPYVTKEAYAAYRERLVREWEENHRAWEAKRRERYDRDDRYDRERRAHYDALDRAALHYDEMERW